MIYEKSVVWSSESYAEVPTTCGNCSGCKKLFMIQSVEKWPCSLLIYMMRLWS